ncbi:MAG TPA: hypothetical protein VK846_01085, partial [Candidatus Limnocylindria bacterium]|nr:hypothetical protein [Candidatus Limnocylindria bacterium]
WNEVQQQIRDALGERYGDWMRAQDPDYRELVRVTTRFKLPATVAAQLYSFKQPVEQERANVEADSNLTTQQKDAAFQAIANETHRAYKEALGEKAFRYYERRTSNPWVRAAKP